MFVQRLDHYNIKASAAVLENVKQFYINLLDLKEGFRPSFLGKGAWLYNGDHAIIHLSLVDSVKLETGAEPSLDHVAFRCTDYAACIEKLTEMKVAYQEFIIKELNLIQLFFRDPAGIRVELNFLDPKGV